MISLTNITRVYILLILLLSAFSTIAEEKTKFTAKQILADLAYLEQSLEETNYNLYAYVNKQEFSSKFKAIRNSINSNHYSRLEANTIFQRAVATASIGHTNVDFPISDYRDYAINGGTLFPLELAFENEKSLVRKSYLKPSDIEIGDQLISINDEPIEAILADIKQTISAETDYFKLVKVEGVSFPRLLWKVRGEIKQFKLVLKRKNKNISITVKSIDAIEGFESKKTEILNFQTQLKFFDNSAYLNPGSFSGDEDKYQDFIDQAFSKILNKESTNLIIDLRNNAGGNDSFSDYLVSYIATKPFQWTSAFTLKTSKPLKQHTRKNMDLSKDYNKKILQYKDGEVYDYPFENYQPQPKAQRFTGKVYVLINRHSHSQATVTAAQIKDYGWGTLVGETTAEFPTLYASQFSYPLPNTGIIVKSSKGYIVRVNGDKTPKGLEPDIFIKDYLVDENDEILTGLLKRL